MSTNDGVNGEGGERDADDVDTEFDLDRRPPRVEVAPEIAALRNDVAILSRVTAFLTVVVLALCCWAITEVVQRHYDTARPAPAPSDRDLTEAQLLKPGLHCFSGPAEMGAARQRALAAIDRYRWQNRSDHERNRTPSLLGGAPLSHPEGHLSIWKPPPSEDASKCFDIELPMGGGPYLPFDS